jgi:hypothetical protein
MADEPHQFEWVEPLPDDCPPAEAERPDNREFFRLVGTIPPADHDFDSNRKLRPRHWLGPDECSNRACSLWNTYQQCDNKRKLPTLKTKKVVKLTLPPESGVILRTHHSSGGHHSWWRAKGFDPCAHWAIP